MNLLSPTAFLEVDVLPPLLTVDHSSEAKSGQKPEELDKVDFCDWSNPKKMESMECYLTQARFNKIKVDTIPPQ